MSWTLRSQMLVPITALLALFIFQLATWNSGFFLSYLDLLESSQTNQFAQKLGSFDEKSLPNELRQLVQSHPGWQLAVFRGKKPLASTLPLSERNIEILGAVPASSNHNSGRDLIIWNLGNTKDRKYWTSIIEVPNWPSDTKLVGLYSVQYAMQLDDRVSRRIHYGAIVLVLIMIVVATWLSGKLGTRIHRIQDQVHQIAAGDFSHRIKTENNDELTELANSVNSMADELEVMRRKVAQTERERLYIQLSGGIAHELRNGVHAARLSLEVFQDGCDTSKLPDAELLDNTQDQLLVTETLVKRLLSIGKAKEDENITKPIHNVLTEVSSMIEPICRHAEIDFKVSIDEGLTEESEDSESLQAAIFNLCLNGVEAIGRQGQLCLEGHQTETSIEIAVSDTGAGPAVSIQDQIFEPFVTSKEEGVGLGLSQVRQTVQNAGGSVRWERDSDKTVFVIQLPKNQTISENGIQPTISNKK